MIEYTERNIHTYIHGYICIPCIYPYTYSSNKYPLIYLCTYLYTCNTVLEIYTPMFWLNIHVYAYTHKDTHEIMHTETHMHTYKGTHTQYTHSYRKTHAYRHTTHTNTSTHTNIHTHKVHRYTNI